MTESGRDLDIVEAIVSTFCGRIESKPQKLTGGSVNKVFRVHASGQDYVVRFQEDRARFGECQKETWCSDITQSLHIPTTEIVKSGRYQHAEFLIQRFIDGTPGTHLSIDPVVIWSTLGRYLAEIHSVPTNGFGLELVDRGTRTFSDSYERYLNYNIESLTKQDQLLRHGYIGPEESAFLREQFEALSHSRLKLGLCHGDISLRNTLIDSRGKVYLIDWGCAHSDVVPYSDFANILRFEQPTAAEFDHFLHGYGMSAEEFAAIEPTLKQVTLLIAVDKLRWAIAQSHTPNRRYLAGLRWALKITAGNRSWFDEPYSEAFAENR